MTRYLWGGLAALLLASAGIVWWASAARDRPASLTDAPAGAGRPLADADARDDTTPAPPRAVERTKEQRRFHRYDRDDDGKVAREEYLAARRKAFAKLDLNGDGRLSFEEYAAKSIGKFEKADADKGGTLDPREFATTRVVRRAPAVKDCPPDRKAGTDDEG